MLPPRSRLAELEAPRAFLWLTGIEDTFVFDPSRRTGRALDEYELTQHYGRWRSDLDLAARLGVRAMRYGIPWYKVNPAPGKWDWSFAGAALDYLLELGIEPIVDLVHYGTPGWLDRGFLNPDYARYVAEYAAAVANRYRSAIRWYTPLNEPRITAQYCGKLGMWPPYLRGWPGFLKVMLGACKGIVATSKALGSVDPEIVSCHVDATDLYECHSEEHAAETRLRQEIVFLALDLITGRVDHDHPLRPWLVRHSVTERDLEWFEREAIDLDLLGINLYPMFSLKKAHATKAGLRFRMPYTGGPKLVSELVPMYYERYRVPILITETASVGSFGRRRRWMDDSVGACRLLREGGVPLVGYTWWPMFSLVGWAYRGSSQPIDKYLLNMGFWDLDSNLDRRPTPLIDAFERVMSEGSPGELRGLVAGGERVT